MSPQPFQVDAGIFEPYFAYDTGTVGGTCVITIPTGRRIKITRISAITSGTSTISSIDLNGVAIASQAAGLGPLVIEPAEMWLSGGDVIDLTGVNGTGAGELTIFGRAQLINKYGE